MNSIKIKQNKFILLIIGFFIFIATLAFFFYTKKTVKKQYIELDSILTSINSSKDGLNKLVKIDFAIEVDKKNEKYLLKDKIYTNLSMGIQKLDYLKISQKDGFDYIKSQVVPNIINDFEIIDNIYIYNIQSQNAITNSNTKFKTKKQEQIFKSIFPNM